MILTATWYNVLDLDEDLGNGALFFWFPFFKKNHEANIGISATAYGGLELDVTNFGTSAQLHNVPYKHTKTLYHPFYLKRYNTLRPEVRKVIEDEYRKTITNSNQSNTTT